MLMHIDLWPTAIKLNPSWKTVVSKSPWIKPWTIEINPKRSQIIIEKIKNFLGYRKATTRQLVSVIGSCIYLFPALPLGKLLHRNLEKEKTKALKLRQGNFNSKLGTLNSLTVQKLYWRLQHIPKACRHICLPKTDFTIYTDASELS